MGNEYEISLGCLIALVRNVFDDIDTEPKTLQSKLTNIATYIPRACQGGDVARD